MSSQGHVNLLQSLVCLNGDIIRKDTINAMAPGNAKFLMDSVFELAQRMNHFRLSDAEIGLFCAVVIITPGMKSVLSKNWIFLDLIIEVQCCIDKWGTFFLKMND